MKTSINDAPSATAARTEARNYNHHSHDKNIKAITPTARNALEQRWPAKGDRAQSLGENRVGGGNHASHPDLISPAGKAREDIYEPSERTAAASPLNMQSGNATTNPHGDKPEHIHSAQAPFAPESNATAATNATTPSTRARALVSSTGEINSMLICEVLLGGQLRTAHLDSCATHCFVSSNMSRELAGRGYPR